MNSWTMLEGALMRIQKTGDASDEDYNYSFTCEETDEEYARCLKITVKKGLWNLGFLYICFKKTLT